MKIGVDSKRYFSNFTGLGNYSRWLVDELAKEVDLTLFNPKPILESNKNVVSPSSFLSELLPSIWRNRWIVSDLQKHGIEVYHGLSNEIPIGIHKTNIKTVVTIHDLINLRFPKQYSAIDRYIYKQKLDYAVTNASAIVTPSEQTKKDIDTFYPSHGKNIHVIPLGLNPKIEVNDSTVASPYIVCISGFSKRKNIIGLIDAYNGLSDYPFRLILAGSSGDTSNEVRKLAQENASIQIEQNISDERKAELIAGSVFCIYPSFFEGFGIPVLEAFQYGRTIATSISSSLPEVGKEAAYYFNPADLHSIQKALLALTDDKVRDELESKIPIVLSHFQTSQLVSKYIQLYKSL